MLSFVAKLRFRMTRLLLMQPLASPRAFLQSSSAVFSLLLLLLLLLLLAAAPSLFMAHA
jgi:hypothetical protein